MIDNWNSVETATVKKMCVWLQDLTKVSPDLDKTNDESPKVLFLLDNDYGELTTVLYLILGQRYFHQSKILLTPHLYKKNKNVLPGRVEKWSSEQDLVHCIEDFQPDILVIAAGYLLPVHNLLTTEALERICLLASNLQAEIITADPFLGLISQWSQVGLDQIISIDIPTNASDKLSLIKRHADVKLHKELTAANVILRDYLHLYPTYTDMDNVNTVASDSKNRSFFNENLLIPEELQGIQSDSKPHWVFIISDVDFQTQSMFLGPEKFASIVLDLLVQGVSLGRKVIFLGPSNLIDILRSQKVSNNENIHLFNFAAFERVMALLLTAEYSFYWNVVSHSILMQLWNGKPVILFDKGHLARAVPLIYDRVIAWYYQGWEPNYFDQNVPISLDKLANVVKDHSKNKFKLMKSYQRAVAPETLFNSLIGSKLIDSNNNL